MEKYIVTYLADYPCGHRHPLSVAMEAHNAMDAIEKSQEALADERLTLINHTLFSVMPEAFNENTIGSLDACSKTEVKS